MPQRPPFIMGYKLANWAWDSEHRIPANKLILFVMALPVDETKGPPRCWMSVKTLAECSGYRTDHVRDVLEELRTHGFIVRQSRGNSHRASVYTFDTAVHSWKGSVKADSSPTTGEASTAMNADSPPTTARDVHGLQSTPKKQGQLKETPNPQPLKETPDISFERGVQRGELHGAPSEAIPDAITEIRAHWSFVPLGEAWRQELRALLSVVPKADVVELLNAKQRLNATMNQTALLWHFGIGCEPNEASAQSVNEPGIGQDEAG